MNNSKKTIYIVFSFLIVLFFSSCIFNESNISDISVKPVGVPTNIHAESSVNGIRITWNAVDGADYYRLCYASTSESYLGDYEVTSTSYMDTQVWPGDVWYYYVYAVKDGMTSDLSYTVSGQRVMTCGRWEDVQIYSYNYPLIYTDVTDTILYNEQQTLNAGEHRYHYFSVKGGTSYTILVADENRNSDSFYNTTPATVTIYYFPAGAESSAISLGSTTSETTFKAELTGYYMFYVYAQTKGDYIINVLEASEE